MRTLAMNLAVPAGGTVSGPSISRFVIAGVVLGRNGEIGTRPESHAARLPASARAIPEWTRSRVDFMMPPIWLLTKSSSAVPLNVRQEETGQGSAHGREQGRGSLDHRGQRSRACTAKPTRSDTFWPCRNG
jgi:hypothetical protein